MALPVLANVPTNTLPAEVIPPEALALVAGILFFVLLWMLALHIYKAIVLMVVAKKTNTPNGWLAFIPVAHLFLKTQIAKVHWAFMFIPIAAFALGYVPVVGPLIFWATLFIWNGFIFWKICEARGKPGWWGILMVIPLINLVMLALLAWQD